MRHALVRANPPSSNYYSSRPPDRTRRNVLRRVSTRQQRTSDDLLSLKGTVALCCSSDPAIRNQAEILR